MATTICLVFTDDAPTARYEAILNSNNSLSTFNFESTSIFNVYDKVDIRDADFSIQSKPPKILNNALFDSVNIIDPQKVQSFNNELSEDTVSTGFAEYSDSLVDECLNSQKFDLNVLNEESLLSLQVDLSANVTESLSLHCREENLKSEDIQDSIVPLTENNLNEEKRSFLLDLNVNIIKTPKSATMTTEDGLLESCSENNYEHEINKLENCDKTISDKSISLLDNNNIECNEVFPTVFENEMNNCIVNLEQPFEGELLIKNSKFEAENIVHPINTNQTNLNKTIKIDIDNLSEEDLDKFLSDLNQNINDENKNESNQFASHKNESESEDLIMNSGENIEQKREEVLTSSDNNIEPNGLLNCKPNTKLSSLIEENNQSNSQNDIETSSETIVEVPSNDDTSDQTEIQQSQVTVNSNSINTNNHGGLVQNIAYFERQEMPNGLTEEEQMLGKVKPFWIPDEEAQNCLHCDTKFTLIKRRHHCRYFFLILNISYFKISLFSSCGKVLCSQCCNFKAKLMYLENKEARVCQLCYAILMRSIYCLLYFLFK